MPIKTLVVDDTVMYRKVLSQAVEAIGQLELVGTAPSGEIALKKIDTLQPHLVLLDIQMPDLDGVETLKRIKVKAPKTLVVMISAYSSYGADITIRALENGAIDFIRKPDSGTPEENFEQLCRDIKRLLPLIETHLHTKNLGSPVSAMLTTAAAPPVSTAPKVSETAFGTADVKQQKAIKSAPPLYYAAVAIGVSTGGPEALVNVIPKISKGFSVPILLVQHMPPFFTRSLAESLARKAHIAVVEAEDGEMVLPGKVYLAPGGLHMVVRTIDETVVIGLNDGPPENSCRPSVDVLFRSVASVYGDQGVLGVILTGMGNDGLSGIRALKRKSCFCISQSESSCVVYGMPRAIDEAGLSDISLPLDEIGPYIDRSVRERGRAYIPTIKK